MHDLQSRHDLDLLVRLFYQKLMVDPLIGHFFNQVVKLDLDHHLPIIASFWEMALFGTGTYQSNPMTKHFALDQQSPLKPEHFDRWLSHWKSTLQENFSGPKANEALSRAQSIAAVMLHRIEQQR